MLETAIGFSNQIGLTIIPALIAAGAAIVAAILTSHGNKKADEIKIYVNGRMEQIINQLGATQAELEAAKAELEAAKAELEDIHEHGSPQVQKLRDDIQGLEHKLGLDDPRTQVDR